MRYEKPVWVFFRRRKISHLVQGWLMYRSDGWAQLETVCGRRIDIEDPVLDLKEISGFDPRGCVTCRRSWDV